MPTVRSQTRRPAPVLIQQGPVLGEAGLAQSRWRLEQRLLPRAPAPAQGSPQLSLVVTLAQAPLCGCLTNCPAQYHNAAHSGPWRLEDHTPCLEATPLPTRGHALSDRSGTHSRQTLPNPTVAQGFVPTLDLTGQPLKTQRKP